MLGPEVDQIVISGQVLMAGDRAPVPGARLVATTNRTGEWSQLQRATVLSAADGRYTIRLDCPRGARLSVFMGYEAGRSVLGEPGRDDLVIHAAERDGRTLDSGLLDERISCTRTISWMVDLLLKTPLRAPVEVAGGHRFSGISAGSNTVCGVTHEGAAYCWGNGALGDGRYLRYDHPGSTPVLVARGLTFVEVSTGSDFACGVTTHEEAYCWGGYHTNAMGDGALAGSPRLMPARVAGGHRFRTITTGTDHACALTPEDDAYCWGVNSQGELGAGWQGPPSASPVPVVGGLRFRSIVAGRHHTCALTIEGRAYCWGYGPLLGADLTATAPYPYPVPVAAGHTFATLTSGSAHTCGLTQAGAALCWGGGSAGQLGSGTSAQISPVPVAVAGGHRFISISAGYEHTCAVAPDHRVYCWGTNEHAQFGSTVPARSSTPVAAPQDLRLAVVEAGDRFTCGLGTDATAFCWGVNSSVLGALP